MRRVKYGAYAPLFAILLIALLVVSSGTASATSDYDEVIKSVDSVHLSRDGAIQGSPTCASVDITRLWTNILTNPSSWTSRTQIIGGATQSATLADWATTLEHEVGWSVVQQHNNNASTPDSGSPIADAVYLIFTPSLSAQVKFSSDAIYRGAQKQAYMTNSDGGYVYSVRIQLDDLGSSGGDDKCTPVISMALRESAATTSYKELLSIAATSTESSGGYSLRPLFVNANINYPSGYKGKIIPTEPPSAKYVAMGDSFSSGEGTFNYDPSSGACHRSPKSYPYYVADRRDLGVPLFAACSGAQTNDFYNANPSNVGEPAQLTQLSKGTQFVTLTIGGNDGGFLRVLSECATYPGNAGFGCSGNSSLVNAVRKHLAALAGTATGTAEDGRKIESLRNVYRSVHQHAPNAKIFVAGYPRLFGTDKTRYQAQSGAPSGSICKMTLFTVVDYADAQWMNSQAAALNNVIVQAVNAVRGEGVNIFYVPPALFSGHGQCDTQEEWINTIVVDGDFPVPHPMPESMHPNVTGQSAGYGAAFVVVMKQR